ncbi:putative cytokinetic ring protein SteA [Corynebacterium macclintockiae]|uniref:putative cytokinetic ring protein SteA n=1 Tax=Corynebacterium macclintockiae TaxID=2913501 RepID=UPI003EBDDC19
MNTTMVGMIFSRSDQPGINGATRDLTGPKGLTKAKISEGDIAIVDEADISRATCQKLIDARVAAVVNARQFTTGQVPNFGPQLMLDEGILLIENAGDDLLAKVKNGKKGRVDEGKVYYGDRSIGGGELLDMDTASSRFEDAREALGDHMEALSGNMSEFVRSEAPLLVDGLGIPDVDVDMDDRKVLVASPDPQIEQKLKDLRYFMREYSPIIVAVENAADSLIQEGYRPNVIIGDPEKISNEALRSGATVVLPADPDGYAVGLERIQDLGVGAMTFPAATQDPTDLALLLANYHGASMVVNLGEVEDLDRVFQQAQSPETPSALMSRLRVGPRLVDSTAVAELYRVSRSGGGWIWALLGVLVAVAVIVAVIGFSGDGSFVDNLVDTWNNFALSVQDLFKK